MDMSLIKKLFLFCLFCFHCQKQKEAFTSNLLISCPANLCPVKNTSLKLFCWVGSWNPASYQFVEQLAKMNLFTSEVALQVFNLKEWEERIAPHLKNWGTPQEASENLKDWFKNPLIPQCLGLNIEGQVLLTIQPKNIKEAEITLKSLFVFNFNLPLKKDL
jgi:hypothetical protein